MFVKEIKRVKMHSRHSRIKNQTNVNYGLRHTLGTIRIWDAKTYKNIFEDIEIRVSDFSHRLRVLLLECV